ncbi:Uncharacterized protein conserved in bacteria [Staphylococcus aureus]|uniref:Uncharacterized protein n=1 Tax=Staphylococcus aureus TaxID=1280 RepID=Q936H3_STAAU|nr:unknown [Staphylococcus aureus]SUJ43595.1 Uncharacterized protein conserved in bacteria [Staphylococcus aureus]
MNKVVEMDEFGSINFVNLYSNITTPINFKHLETLYDAYDKHTDIQIMKAAKESDEVIEMLKPHKKKVKQLINPESSSQVDI